MDDKQKKRMEELERAKKNLAVKELWSWTKYKCWLSDPWEYYLHYVKKVPYDRANPTMYLKAGTYIHGVLEWLAHATYGETSAEYKEQIAKAFHDKLDELEMQGCRFKDGSDKENRKLRKNYEDNLTDMLLKKNFMFQGKRMTEVFLYTRIKERRFAFAGYADLITKKVDTDGKTIFTITDYKTSSLYDKKKREQEKYQLLLYAKGLHDNYKVPYENIRIGWEFLRYVKATVQHKNGKKRAGKMHTYYCERTKVGERLYNAAKNVIKTCWSMTEEEKQEALDYFAVTNKKDRFSLEMQRRIIIEQGCFIEIPFTEKDIDDMCDRILKDMKEHRAIMDEYNTLMNCGEPDKAEQLFMWNVTDKDYYRIEHLGNYTRALHKPLNRYLNEKAKKKEKNTVYVYDDESITESQIDRMLAEAGYNIDDNLLD